MSLMKDTLNFIKTLHDLSCNTKSLSKDKKRANSITHLLWLLSPNKLKKSKLFYHMFSI